MNKNARIILFVLIGLSMSGLIVYGLFYSKKLDDQKVTTVESNINDYLYDEASDTLDLEDDEEEDLDGADAVDEDDDFEVYDEEDDWGDEPTTKIAEAVKEPKIADEELEALYDNSPPSKAAPKPIEKTSPKKITTPENTSEGKYLVIAGSFSSKRNAGKKIKKLEEAGFEGEIIQLKDSKLQTVIAGRFSKERNAEKLAKKIEAEGLRAIVKKE